MINVWTSLNIIYTVESLDVNSITQVNGNRTKREDMLMKNASQLDYNIIIEYKDYLQKFGTCVIDNFIGLYGEELKITKEKNCDLCQEYYK